VVHAPRRRRLALTALGLWALGFELAPNLHVALHAHLAAHHHGHAHDHGHGHSAAHFDGDAAGRAGAEVWRAAGLAIGPERTDAPGHGDHSLAHRQLALAEPPPPPAIDASSPVGFAAAASTPVETPRSRRPGTLRQRGPPVLRLG
jgi:hypothetical protein